MITISVINFIYQGWPIVTNAVENLMYEYACHEGNYSLSDILAGAGKKGFALNNWFNPP